MRKIFAILMALCFLTVFVSAASACCYCPPGVTVCKYQSLSSTQTQLDATNYPNMIGQTQTATASAADGYYNNRPCNYINGVLTATQIQSGTLTDYTAVANQYTSVTATGLYATAASSQQADLIVGA